MPTNTLRRSPLARIVVLTAVVLALAFVLASCSSSSSDGKSSSSKNVGVTIKDLEFTTSPVQTGSTVTVENNDSVDHTVTSDDGDSFNVTVGAGKTATFTAPGTEGQYKFHCNIHTTMKATLVVQ